MKIAGNIACPICSLSDNEFFLSGRDYLSSYTRRFTLVKCAGCGLIYLNPQKELEDAQALYRPDYYRSVKKVSRILEALFLQERKGIVEGSGKSSGTMLDIGCGTGEFLKIMKAGGWETAGVDPSEERNKRSTDDNKIYSADLMEIKFGEQSFDVITLWQVLEHLPDPDRYLAETHRLLKKDGILVLSVPNINSLQARLSGARWFNLDLPRHRWQFTPETLQKMLDKTAFRLKEIKHFSLEYNPFGWWQSILNLLGCEMNFAYKFLKRGVVQKGGSPAARFYTILCTVLLGVPLLLPAFVLSFIESALSRGGIVTVIAQRRPEEG
ncbi:MAG: class I SAM-dependent methyltransferase [Elusimicrobia bacterium]|nr:class I SAM-dependent methyltransferase [Elusimicrobiota bacterium]